MLQPDKKAERVARKARHNEPLKLGNTRGQPKGTRASSTSDDLRLSDDGSQQVRVCVFWAGGGGAGGL
jgi:hypothetical protein